MILKKLRDRLLVNYSNFQKVKINAVISENPEISITLQGLT